MPQINPTDLAFLRRDNHIAQLFMSVAPALSLWSAQIAGVGIPVGARDLSFDNGAGLDFVAVGELQEIWVGTAAGLYDKGRVRIRSVTSGDGGVTGTLNVSSNSIVWADNDFLTFILWYLPKPRRPRLGSDGTFFKDYDIAYTNQNSQPPPVCIAGENRADFLVSGQWVVESQLPDSYAVADGATITSYAAVLVRGSATVNINAGTGVGDITFTSPGIYWVRWSVTDSNGQTQDSYRWYAVHESDPASADYPMVDFDVNSLSGNWENGGWQAAISLQDNATLADVPDLAPVIIWQRSSYAGVTRDINFLPDDSTTVLNGYIRTDRFNEALVTGADTADFTITTIQGVMGNEYNYSVSLEAQPSPSRWYQYAAWLTPGRAVHHFLRWHSTVLEVTDALGLLDNLTGIAFAEMEDGTIYSMPDSFARDRSIRNHLVCDKGGRIHFIPDVQLLPDADRAPLVIVADIESVDKSGDVTIVRQQEKQVPFVHVSGFAFDGTFDGNGDPNATPLCAIAPGEIPSDLGGSPTSLGRQTFVDQQNANDVAGRVAAAANNEFREMRMTFNGNYLGVLDVAYAEFWQMSMLATENLRGIVWTNQNLITRRVEAQIDTTAGTIFGTVTFEPEAAPFAGATTNCPEFPALEGQNLPVPIDEEAGGGLITAGSVYRLPAQSLDWSLITAEATSDLITDPLWPSRQGTISSSSAIVWRCGVGYVRRSTDGGQTYSTVTPADDPPNNAGDAPAPTVGAVEFAQLSANPAVQSEFVAIARWQNAVNDWRSWLVYTNDDGANWSYASLSDGGTAGTFAAADQDSSTTPAESEQSDFAIMTEGFVLVSNDIGSVSRFTLSGTTVTFDAQASDGTPPAVVADTGPAMYIDRLSDTRAVVAMAIEVIDPDFLFNSGLIVRTIERDTLTFNAALTLSTVPPNGGVAPNTDSNRYGQLRMVALSSTRALVVCTRYERRDLVEQRYIQIDLIEIDGAGTCTLLDSLDFQPTPPFVRVLAVSRFTDSTAVMVYSDNGDIYGAAIFTATDALIVEVANELLPSADWVIADIFVNTLSSTNLTRTGIVNYAWGFLGNFMGGGNLSYVAGLNLSNLGVWSIGTPVSFAGAAIGNGAGQLGLTAAGGNNILVSHADWTVEEGTVSNTTVVASGVTYTWGFNGSGAEIGAIGRLNDTIIIGSYPETPPGIIRATLATATVDSDLEFRALGIEVDKFTSLSALITGWRGGVNELSLVGYDLLDLSNIGEVSLGSATETEVNTQTLIAYPFSPFNTDGALYVYGRMSAPAGLGGLQHVISSLDGFTFSSEINNWGTDRAGSMVADGDDILALRILGGGTVKIYNIATGVISTLLFDNQGVNPHGTAIDEFQGILYVAADTGGSVMILRSVFPYTAWVDITFAHGTVDGVNAIEIL